MFHCIFYQGLLRIAQEVVLVRDELLPVSKKRFQPYPT